MDQLARAVDRFSLMTGNAVRWMALAMVLIQFLIVLARYVFGYNSIAVQESVLYLHGALFMLGAGYTLMMDGHVRVDIFYARAPEAVKRRIDLFGHLFLLIPSMVALLYWSWPMVRSSWRILEGPISVGGLPAVFLLKSLIPAFCILLLLQSLAIILKLLLDRKKQPA